MSVHTLTLHDAHYPPPPQNPRTIQYLIPGWTTIVKLLKQVKNWQSPSRDPWSNCLINSREDDKGQSYYYSGRQKKQFKDNLRPSRVKQNKKIGERYENKCKMNKMKSMAQSKPVSAACASTGHQRHTDETGRNRRPSYA